MSIVIGENRLQSNVVKPRKLSQTFNRAGLEGVGVLIGLGLSERQARVYLALLKADDARARPVANAAGVARQEAYRLLLELQQLGLVQKNLTVPVSYVAVPFPEAVKTLFAVRASELMVISHKAKHVTEKFSQNPPAPSVMESLLPCFGAVCEGEGGKKYAAALEAAQGCVELVCSWVRFRQLCFHFEGELKAALKRGVRVRVVVEKPSRYSVSKWVNALDSAVFELRTMPNAPAAVIAVFDGAQVAMTFDGLLV